MEEEPRVTLEKAEDALSIALKKVRVARVALEEAEDARVTLKEARDAINIALKKVEEVIGDLEEEKQVRVVFWCFHSGAVHYLVFGEKFSDPDYVLWGFPKYEANSLETTLFACCDNRFKSIVIASIQGQETYLMELSKTDFEKLLGKLKLSEKIIVTSSDALYEEGLGNGKNFLTNHYKGVQALGIPKDLNVKFPLISISLLTLD